MICWSSSTARGRLARLASLAALVPALLAAATTSRAGEPARAPAPAPAVAQAAALPDLDGLLARFAAMPGLRARFREEKRMALLAMPLVNEGVLYFQPPGRLVRHTTAPARSSVLIDRERLTFGDERGVEAIQLAGNPALALFVASFVKIFAGDREALVSMYAMEVRPWPEGGAEGWALQLRPKVAPIDKILEKIEIHGSGVVVHRMRVVELGGDETITTFSEVDTARRFSDAELVELFRVDVRAR